MIEEIQKRPFVRPLFMNNEFYIVLFPAFRLIYLGLSALVFFFWGSRGGKGMLSCNTIPVGYGEL